MSDFGETSRDHTEIQRRAQVLFEATVAKMRAGDTCGNLTDDELDELLPDSKPYSRRYRHARAHAQEG